MVAVMDYVPDTILTLRNPFKSNDDEGVATVPCFGESARNESSEVPISASNSQRDFSEEQLQLRSSSPIPTSPANFDLSEDGFNFLSSSSLDVLSTDPDVDEERSEPQQCVPGSRTPSPSPPREPSAFEIFARSAESRIYQSVDIDDPWHAWQMGLARPSHQPILFRERLVRLLGDKSFLEKVTDEVKERIETREENSQKTELEANTSKQEPSPTLPPPPPNQSLNVSKPETSSNALALPKQTIQIVSVSPQPQTITIVYRSTFSGQNQTQNISQSGSSASSSGSTRNSTISTVTPIVTSVARKPVPSATSTSALVDNSNNNCWTATVTDQVLADAYDRLWTQTSREKQVTGAGKVLLDTVFTEQELMECSFSGRNGGKKYPSEKILLMSKAIRFLQSNPKTVTRAEFNRFMATQPAHQDRLTSEDFQVLKCRVLIEIASQRRKKLLSQKKRKPESEQRNPAALKVIRQE